MNQKKIIKVLGTATVFAAFGLVACGDDSSSSPVVPDEITSSETNGLPDSSNSNPVSSSDVAGSSSSVKVQCNAFMPECGYSLEELCAMGYAQYCTGSSSSMVNPESSSAVNSSSSQSKDQCVPMPHVEPGVEISYQIPICSQEEEGTTQSDCKTDDVYVCLEGRWTNIQTETCRHITDVGDPMKPHSCDTEFEVAMDCAKNYYMMCAGGIWLNATGCDTTKERCGFADYKLCNNYNLREYCTDDWLDEPCQEGESRDLRKYDNENSTNYSLVNYICVEGRWVDRMSYYNCPEGRDCGSGGFQDCWQSDIIGTTCNERDPETSWISKDGCDFQCRDGKYEFMPPPTR